MSDRAEKAKAKLREQLKEKYAKRINKESDAKRREEKWVAGLSGDGAPAPSSSHDGDKVMVEIDHRTRVLVSRDKCEFVDGKWRKKIYNEDNGNI